MAGFEADYVLGEATWRQRRARDWRLFGHPVRVFWMRCTADGKPRRAHREARCKRPWLPERLLAKRAGATDAAAAGVTD